MNIHILCDSPKTMSGFARVGRNLYEGLTKLGHTCSMTGFQTTHESEFFGDNKNEVMPINVQYIDDISQYVMNAQKSKSEVVICIFNADNTEQNQYAKVIKPCIWYVPIEGKRISEMMANDLLQVSKTGKIVAQCNWGHDEMKKAGIESKVIYHGYDEKVFRKLENNEKPDKLVRNEKVNMLRHKEGKWEQSNTSTNRIISNMNHTDNKFIFGFIGANHGVRKRIERLLTSYALFLKMDNEYKKDTLLILRTMPISITGINLIKVCEDLGIENNIVFLYGDNNRLSDEAMNAIYNMFDVNVSCSSSEGFGFPTLESMACGVPQIGPECSSFIELIGHEEKRRGLTSNGIWQMIPDGSYRYLVNEEDMAITMLNMYGNPIIRKDYSKNCLEFTKQYTWNKVIKQWDDLLNEMFPKKL